ncbi:MAG: hypothetical protein JJT75_09740 [Opitutales bacterium]|nr:hypothetical protein [Opitutales bacterium]MCH8539969.1 hypothetical protein [Opitutales bacterium]
MEPSRRLNVIFLFSIVSFIVGTSTVEGIVIDGFETETNDRFSNDSSFIANDFNLSGVALSDNGRWVTMISPNVYISSEHFRPGSGQNVTFYASNDPNGPTVTRTTTATQERVGDSDIWIGTIDSPLSSSFAYYNFATQNTTNNQTVPVLQDDESFINSPYFEATAFHFGRSPTSWSISQDIAVGQNVIDHWFGEFSAANTTGEIAFGSTVDEEGDGNYVAFESFWEIGDSGSPVLVEDNGELVLVGTGWFTTGNPDRNGFAYIGNYTEEIETFLEAHSIPEPSTYAVLLGFATFGLVLYRRRCRHAA